MDRMVLFKMAQLAGFDVCYRCHEMIERWEDLSLDHKKSWGSNPEKFWDLDNVAFSHKMCNYRDGGDTQKKV